MNFAIIILGATSVLLQFILIRELQISFLGNELTLSIILSFWLAGSSLGSYLAGILLKKINSKQILSLLFVFTYFWCIAGLFLSRSLKAYLGSPVYEAISLQQISLISALTIIPLSLSLGFSFVAATLIIERPVKVYFLEAQGAFIAGLFSLILPLYLDSTQIIFAISCLILLSALIIVLKEKNKMLRISLLLFFALNSLFLVSPLTKAFRNATEKIRFSPQELIASGDSIYGNIAITKFQSVYNLFENGKLYFSTEDTEGLEELANMTLLTQESPKRVLLIGSGVSGLAKEILKFPIKNLDYVELDARLIKMALEYIPQVKNYSLKDKRLAIYNQDARFFTASTSNKYDVIIMNLGDPLSLQFNRFYTVEFFNQIKRILNKRGIFSFTISSKEDILRGDTLRYNTSLYKSAKRSFNNVEIVPGERMILACSDDISHIFTPSILEARLEELNINNEFFSRYQIKSKLLSQKYVLETLEANLKNVKENYDYSPHGFFYALCVWGKSGYLNFSKIMRSAEHINLSYIVGLFLIFAFFLRKNIVKITILTTGLSGITLAIITALLFQINFGFLYYQLGAIIGCFMLGIAIGSLTVNTLTEKANAIGGKLLLYTESCTCLLVIMCPIILKQWILIYFLITILIGFMVGFEFGIFCLFNKVSTVYSLDALGACLGSLLVGLIIIPVLGLYDTCLTLGLVKFIGILFLKRQAR